MGTSYYNYNKEPPNSLGNYFGPYIRASPSEDVSVSLKAFDCRMPSPRPSAGALVRETLGTKPLCKFRVSL